MHESKNAGREIRVITIYYNIIPLFIPYIDTKFFKNSVPKRNSVRNKVRQTRAIERTP
ncbi:hypothetical protein SBF1_840021 [Candidatus Desulfosporosinus infrequens]|uniref:Uncharacterized protein n=1 Tax=Candidatus Desulfosporosinus infrequens TaxID=2043169 RepID=A0A2U3LUC8_9FIRM|nr:hypothetical protein SBF1_840021 [Candidatus Desulfosporosinus infrequens]